MCPRMVRGTRVCFVLDWVGGGAASARDQYAGAVGMVVQGRTACTWRLPYGSYRSLSTSALRAVQKRQQARFPAPRRGCDQVIVSGPMVLEGTSCGWCGVRLLHRQRLGRFDLGDVAA